jgi:hypothetical protein
MTDIQVFAFIVLPVLVTALGWAAALLHTRSARLQQQRERAH